MSLDADVRVERGSLALSAELRVHPGEPLAIAGPNAAGKTTLLHAIAGLVPLTGGRVTLDGAVHDEPSTGAWVPPERRSIGLVFQHDALFPHLNALENVAFGLRRRAGRSAARNEAAAWLERLDAAGAATLRPAQLSGGLSRRVALARTLCTRPRALLLDEPLEGLDVGTAATVRGVLRDVLSEHDGPALLVTHDPLDAATVAGRVAVLEAGRVIQSGTFDELSARPASSFVAEYASVNLFRGRSDGRTIVLAGGERLIAADPIASGVVVAFVEPRAVALHVLRPEGSPRNVWPGTVSSMEGDGERVRVRVAGPMPLVAEITAAAVAALRIRPGAQVFASFKATEVRVRPA